MSRKFQFGHKYKKKKKAESGLPNSLGMLDRVRALFDAKTWQIEKLYSPAVSTFDSYCQMLEPLAAAEADLILELSFRFHRIRYDEYAKLLIKCINKLDSDLLKDEILVVPIVKESDFRSTKSGDHIAYLFNIAEVKLYTKLAGKIIRVIHPNKLRSDINFKDKSLLLIDDFIGTGDTANNAIDYLIKEKNIPINEMNIICLAIMKTGLDSIMSRGIHVVYELAVPKGISDYSYTDIQKKDYLEIMGTIGKNIKVGNDYIYGYKESEALISLIKTPNNTFPIFWAGKPKYNNVAPFPRF